MNRAEVVKLCRLVKACCPSQTLDQYTPEAWGIILGRYDYADAKQAVADLVGAPLEPGKSRYIEPGHVIGGINRIRNARVAHAETIAVPPGGLGAAEYLAWQRRTYAAIGSGTYRPTVEQVTARPEIVAQIRAITMGETE